MEANYYAELHYSQYNLDLSLNKKFIKFVRLKLYSLSEIPMGEMAQYLQQVGKLQNENRNQLGILKKNY